MKLDLGRLLSSLYVQHLHSDGEGHGEINVALGDVLMESLGDQQGADHDQETEREDFH